MPEIETHDLVQKIPAGIITFTDDGNIVFINDWLLDLLCYQSEHLHGKKIEHILTLASRIFYQTHLFPLIKLNNKVEEVFLSLKSSQANEIPVLIYGQREEREKRCLNTLVIVVVWQRQKYEGEILKAKHQAEKIANENTDLITARRELEFKSNILDKQVLRLRQINKQFTAFSKVISHDLQEPIRKISVFINSIKQAAGPVNDKVIAYFNKVDGSINRLRLLTDCLSQFVSLSGNSGQAQTLALNKIIEESFAQASLKCTFHDITIEIDNLPDVQGYASQMKQLFYELVKNSIQYRDESRRLRISIKGIITQYNDYRVNEDRYKYVDFMRIEYNDNACGFPNEYNEYVFEIFKRLNLDIDGLGFGLTVCRKILDNHFGTIHCESTPGTGTTFTMLFPINLPDFSYDGTNG